MQLQNKNIMRRKIIALFMLLSLEASLYAQTPKWVGTFATAVEYTGVEDMPRNTNLANTTLREIIHVSLGGTRLEVQLSNEKSCHPVEIKAVYLADALDSCNIDPHTARWLKFNGKRSVILPAGKAIYSDALDYQLRPLQRLAVTICYGSQVPENATSHRGSRTLSYIAKGMIRPGKPFVVIDTPAHWYNLSKINVLSSSHAIAILGNSITDGRGSTTGKQNRWTDFMAEALNGNAGVLNLGIGGNCVISGGISDPALKRFDRDILDQKGVDRLIIFEGTNDIGCCKGNAEEISHKLIEAYQTMTIKARAKGIKVYGATITPFKGNGWYTFFHEAARQTVNQWIRTSGAFDGVIDFDQLVRDEKDPEQIRPEYSFDWLHLNPKGYEVMGKFAAQIIQGNNPPYQTQAE